MILKQHKGSEARSKVRCRCSNKMRNKREGEGVLLAAVMWMTTIRMMQGGMCQIDKRHWEWNCCRRRGFANEDKLLITNRLFHFFPSLSPLLTLLSILLSYYHQFSSNKGKRNKRPKLIVTEKAAPKDDDIDDKNDGTSSSLPKQMISAPDETTISSSSSSSLSTSDTTKVLHFTDLPPSVRVHVYNYRGETQEEMIDTMLISKQAKTDCHPNNPCLEWTITPTLTIGPLDKGYSDERDDFQRTTRFLRNLRRHQQDETKRRIFTKPP